TGTARLLFSRPVARRDLRSFPTRRSSDLERELTGAAVARIHGQPEDQGVDRAPWLLVGGGPDHAGQHETDVEAVLHHPAGCGKRSEEHTSELQSRFDLVCRLLLEQKNARI